MSALSFVCKNINNHRNFQHDLTPRIYVLHKITIALKFVLHKSKVAAKLSNRVKFMSYINWKFWEEVHEEERCNWQLVGITDTERGIAK